MHRFCPCSRSLDETTAIKIKIATGMLVYTNSSPLFRIAAPLFGGPKLNWTKNERTRYAANAFRLSFACFPPRSTDDRFGRIRHVLRPGHGWHSAHHPGHLGGPARLPSVKEGVEGEALSRRGRERDGGGDSYQAYHCNPCGRGRAGRERPLWRAREVVFSATTAPCAHRRTRRGGPGFVGG